MLVLQHIIAFKTARHYALVNTICQQQSSGRKPARSRKILGHHHSGFQLQNAEQKLAEHLTRHLDVASNEGNEESVHEVLKEVNDAYHRFLPADDVEQALELK